MAKKKVYAVRFESGKTQKFSNWNDCKRSVEGVKNVLFKGFPGEKEADLWLKNFDSDSKQSAEVKVYVDGSFSPNNPNAGWGWVAVKNNHILTEESGTTLEKAESRNIDGELMASIQAIRWAKSNNFKVTIVYDYSGIEQWAIGAWKAKSNVAINYLRDLKETNYPVKFEKVEGHSGDKWNDYADNLAQTALRNLILEKS